MLDKYNATGRGIASVLFMLIAWSSSQAQVITLAFTGTYQDSPVQLDSILIMNLTESGDTMLYYPNTDLVLGSSGMMDLDSGSAFQLYTNYPNPFSGTTNVDLLVKNGGSVRMRIISGSGSELADYTRVLSPGIHHFQVHGGLAGVQVLLVELNNELRAIRMAHTGDSDSIELRYISSRASGTTKSEKSLFTWELGDELRYIGYGTVNNVVHSDAIDAVPSISDSHAFELTAGKVCPESPTVTDIDSNTYPAVSIGSQCWMAENLHTTRHRDGTVIPTETEDFPWAALTSDAWCHYDNDAINDIIYGKLYNWYAASNPQVCPQGWHVPTETEWQLLETALGMPVADLLLTAARGNAQNIGGQLKSTSTLWIASNVGATNESGFAGLPGGYRTSGSGNFNYIGFFGYFWSSTENGSSAWERTLATGIGGIYRDNVPKAQGRSIRCVKD